MNDDTKAIKLRTLSAEVEREVRQAILKGTLKPGEPLVLDVFASRFGVSRLPVRDAFRTLAAEGLVTLSAHRGAFVTKLSPDELVEMLEVATVLEILATQRGLERLSEIDTGRMAQLLEEMRAAEDDPWKWFVLNREFHSVIAEASHWERLVALVRTTRMNVGRFLTDMELFEREVRTWDAQHEQIYKSCKDGEADEVLRMSEFHWRYSNRVILADIKKKWAEEEAAAGEKPL